MLKVAVVGASGYTGVELVRILRGHPNVSLTCVTSERSAGKRIDALYPSLRGHCDLVLENLDPIRVSAKADLIFTALPHKTVMEVAPTFLQMGKTIIDLSADYRLNDPDAYGAWYEEHLNPELLREAVYGLPEIRRDEIIGKKLVANPGCYPTSIVLGLAPLLKNNLIDSSNIIIDSASGVTGAGRSAKVDSLYCEVNESFKAYGAGGVHRHIPEIEQELSLLAKERITITFTPHLAPMDRGILSTIYASPLKTTTIGELAELYSNFYREEVFVRVLPEGCLPSTLFVRGSNFCDVAPLVDKRTGKIIVFSAIDNLVKGASGQAVQNMNIVCGFPETMGLAEPALFP